MVKELTIEDVHDTYLKMKEELCKVIVGQDDVVEHSIIALFSGGHILIEGVPGLGKTLGVAIYGNLTQPLFIVCLGIIQTIVTLTKTAFSAKAGGRNHTSRHGQHVVNFLGTA